MVAAVAAAIVLGHSVLGRPIVLEHMGDPTGPRVLVVGVIHGNEPAGLAVVRELERHPPKHVDLWLVPDLNPDGVAAGTRGNAHGVDLNRNFGAMWRPNGRRGNLQWGGPHPLSEPETRIARALILRVRPRVTIWFHQPQALVRGWGHSIAAARRYARLAGAPFRALAWPNGTAPNWQNHRFRDAASFVVELPAGPLAPSDAARYAAAVDGAVG